MVTAGRLMITKLRGFAHKLPYGGFPYKYKLPACGVYVHLVVYCQNMKGVYKT